MSLSSNRQSSLGNALDLLELRDLLALSDDVSHKPPMNDVTVRIQALQATPELVSITLDEIRDAQAADDRLQPGLQTLKDQGQPLLSGIHHPEDTRILLSQRDSLVLQDSVLYQKFHCPDGTTNFLQIVLPAKLHCSYIEQLHADLGHFAQPKTGFAVSSHIYFPGWMVCKSATVQCATCTSGVVRHRIKQHLSPCRNFF